MSSTPHTYIPAQSRYDVPPNWFRRAGNSGLLLPALSLGCWHNFGAPGTDSKHSSDEVTFHANCQRMLFTAFDVGITHFDLANNYGPPPGSAEERVGRILNEDLKAHRDELIISSKAGYTMWPGPYGDWGSRKYIIASCDQSLRRLKLDYVDIFYSHRHDPSTPLEETMGALDTLVRQGKALYIGISKYNGAQTADALAVCERNGFTKPILQQPRYSLFDRAIEPDLLPITARFGLGTVAFTPLAQGLLTNKYLKGIPADSRASNEGFLKSSAITPQLLAKVQAFATIAQSRNQSLAQMALAWALRSQTLNSLAGPTTTQITTALIGASRPEQITENAAYRNNQTFSGEELAKIEQILAG